MSPHTFHLSSHQPQRSAGYARRPSHQSRLSLPCSPATTYAVSFFSTQDYLGLIELSPTLCFSSLLSQHLGSSSSRLLFLSDPTIRVCSPHTAITQPPHPYTHLADHVTATLVGLRFSHFRRFTTVHIQKTLRVSFSRAHKSSSTSPSHPNHIYPLLNPSNAAPQGRPSSLPFLVVFHEVLLWLGPIDRVCVLLVPHLCCVTNDGPQTCTIFLANLRLLSLFRYLKADTPPSRLLLDPLSLLTERTTSFLPADFVATPFPGSLNPPL